MKKLALISLIGVFLIMAVNATAATQQGTRVKELVIEKGVSRSIGKSLELVTFAPGSGWLRLDDQLSPILSFDNITGEDIQKFNRFSKGIGYPFRTKLDGDVLHIQHIRNRFLGTESVVDMRATKKRGFLTLKEQPQLALRKQKSGKIYLAAVKTGQDKTATLRASNQTTKLRKAGFKMVQKSFASLAEAPDLNEVIVLKNVRVHIVGGIKAYNEEAASYGEGVLGYATAGNEITVLGKRVGDKIILNQAVLGHELEHLLNYQDPRIADPDDLDFLGI